MYSDRVKTKWPLSKTHSRWFSLWAKKFANSLINCAKDNLLTFTAVWWCPLFNKGFSLPKRSLNLSSSLLVVSKFGKLDVITVLLQSVMVGREISAAGLVGIAAESADDGLHMQSWNWRRIYSDYWRITIINIFGKFWKVISNEAMFQEYSIINIFFHKKKMN